MGLLGLNAEAAEANAIDGLEMGEETHHNGGSRRLNGLGGVGGLDGSADSGLLGKAHRAADVDWAYDGKVVDVKNQG